MKKVFFFLMLAVSALTLNSCLEGYNDSTPRLDYYLFQRNWQGDSISGDTLRLRFVDNAYVLDTVAVGDSVRFIVQGYSFANSLKSLVFTYDPAALEMKFPVTKEMQSVLDTTRSDVTKGQYVFLPGYNKAGLIVQYKPLVTGTHTFSTIVVSDANKDRVSNEVKVEIKQPVR